MKRLSTIMMCLLAMMAASLSAKAQEVTITLYPGWTWISYPKAEVQDINTALGDFVPVNGDMIKSQFSNSTYVNGYWRGGVTHFIPGLGYKYYSNRTEVVSFVFAGSTPQSQVQVTTSEPMLITAISAMGGGEVTTTDGTYILMKGLCWATHENPTTNDDFFQEAESGVGPFSVSMTGLNISTTYYVRAYAVTPNGTVYGNQLSFTTADGYVDLGLPSGTLWATCNVGANAPEEYGDYFAWGETQPKDVYDWSTYQYCNGSINTLTKYCSGPGWGFTDNLTTLLPEDDAATANWGSDWRMPTKEEWQELLDNTTVIWTQQNGVNGRLFTASNGNSLFLPAAGYRHIRTLNLAGSKGCYWSSLCGTNYPYAAWNLYFSSGDYGVGDDARACGLPVRAVRVGSQSNAPTGAINGKFTINENGDQVYFSQGNLQYIGSAETPYWKFADNQWDYLGDNGQFSEEHGVDRDLFCWATSGFNHGAVCYQPWSTNVDANNYYAYGSLSFNLYDQTGQADWGYNDISNGGNAINQWRTLTKDEWIYVFTVRSTVSGVRYAKAKVNDVKGVILLSDNWSTNYYSLVNTNNGNASFNSNTITESIWLNSFESHGAVFLPAAGYRNGVNGGPGPYSAGFYWSSSSYGGQPYAYGLGFTESVLNDDSYGSRGAGESVRLVKACNH